MPSVAIICAPYHAGAYGERVGAGPLRLLDDGLERSLAAAGHDVRVETVPPADDFEGEIGKTFELTRRISASVSAACRSGSFPLVLAGNCNAEVGVWSGRDVPEAGLIWFDAHPDFDTPDEHRSGYFDGMGVATLAGQCWRNLAATIPGFAPFDVGRLVYCGIRDFSPGQREKVEAAGIPAAIGSKDSRTDYLSALRPLLDDLRFSRALYHLDVDCLDTSVGIANEYAAPGGLRVDELHACVEAALAAAPPLSLTIASFNPLLEGSDRISSAAIEAAVRIVARA